MVNLETFLTSSQFVNPIIVGGELSADDIHSLVLTSRACHAVITDAVRAQSLWQNALPYASAFLFNRTVRVYTQVAQNQGILSYYRVQTENNRQSVQKIAVESGSSGLIVSREVKAFYDCLISFYQVGKLETLDDFWLFQEKHGQDFPDNAYDEMFLESAQENGRLVNYQGMMQLAVQVRNGHDRFKARNERWDQFFEEFIRGFATAIGSLPLRIDELPSLIYLLGSSFHTDFSYTISVFNKVWDWIANEKISPVHLAEGIVEIVRFYHFFESYLTAPEGVVCNGQIHFGPIPQVTEEHAKLLEECLVELLSLPGFSVKVFNRSVSADIQYRDVAVLLEQLNRFIAMIKEGYLTSKILANDYSVLKNEPFLLSYCTEGLLIALGEGLFEFNHLDYDFFSKNPFFFQLENLPQQGSSGSLQRLGRVYLDFLRALKTDLQSYKTGHDDIFIKLIEKILNQYHFVDARSCFDAYVSFDQGQKFDKELRPFFTSVQRGDWTAENLLVIYMNLRTAIEKMISERLHAIDPALYKLYKTSVCHRIFFDFLSQISIQSIEETVDESDLDSLSGLFSFLLERLEGVVESLLNANILTLGHLLFSVEFGEYIRLVSADSSKFMSLLNDRRFGEIARFVLASQYWSYPSFREEFETFQDFLNVMNSLLESKRALYDNSRKYGIRQSSRGMVFATIDNIKKQAQLSLILRESSAVDLQRDIVSTAFNAFASLFDERSSADMVGQLLEEGHFQLATILIAQNMMTMEQYKRMIFVAMKSSILARTREGTLISDAGCYIQDVYVNFIKRVFDYVLKDQLIDYEKCFHKMETDLQLAEDEPPEDDVLEDEMGE